MKPIWDPLDSERVDFDRYRPNLAFLQYTDRKLDLRIKARKYFSEIAIAPRRPSIQEEYYDYLRHSKFTVSPPGKAAYDYSKWPRKTLIKLDFPPIFRPFLSAFVIRTRQFLTIFFL